MRGSCRRQRPVGRALYGGRSRGRRNRSSRSRPSASAACRAKDHEQRPARMAVGRDPQRVERRPAAAGCRSACPSGRAADRESGQAWRGTGKITRHFRAERCFASCRHGPRALAAGRRRAARTRCTWPSRNAHQSRDRAGARTDPRSPTTVDQSGPESLCAGFGQPAARCTPTRATTAASTRFFMNLQALRQQVGGRLVARRIGKRKDRTRGTHDGLVPFDELANHVFGSGHTVRFRHRRQFREITEGAGATTPSVRMRSATESTASHNSLYCSSNIRCSVLNIA